MKKYIVSVSVFLIVAGCSTPSRMALPLITEKDLLMSQTNSSYSDASVLGYGGLLIIPSTSDKEKETTQFKEEIASIEGIEIDPRTGAIRLDQNILFPFNSDQVSESSVHVLQKIAHAYFKLNDARIKVVGYTDNVGEESYNANLSLSRARSVADILIQSGIPKEQLQTEGRGASEFIATNQTAAGRAKNRRVELHVIR